MSAGDHLTVGAERRAERVECRQRDDAVVVAPQHQRRQASCGQCRHLVAEVRRHRDTSRGHHRPRVAQDVLEEHARDQARRRSGGIRQRELDHRIDQRSDIEDPVEQIADDGARIPDGVEHDEIAGHLAVVVGELGRHPTTHAVAQDHHRIGDADRRDEVGDPVGVAGQGPLLGRQRGRAAEARQGRRDHSAAAGGEAPQRSLVRAVIEPPPVQEQHGKAAAARCIHGRPAVDIHAVRDHLIDMPSGTNVRWKVGDHLCDIPHRHQP